MTKILTVQNLHYEYNKTSLISSVSFEIEAGTFTVIAGNNESGKTTLLKLLAGLLPSQKSVIAEFGYVNSKRFYDTARFFGICIEDMHHRFLFEDVYQEMIFSLENLNDSVKDIEKKVSQMAKLFKNVKMLDKKIVDLTNSEKQELTLMIALLHEPKVLLLDDGFKMMTYQTKKKVITILKQLQDQGLTILLTTTNLEDVLETNADRVLVLYQGKIVMEGAPLAVLQEEKILNEVGLELPFMIDLSLKLKFYEVFDQVETSMDRMVDALWK